MGARVSSGKDSKQDYETPRPFVRALEAFLELKFAIDLAGTAENKKADVVITEKENSLGFPWSEIGGVGWLNPPFKFIRPWARKFSEEAKKGFRGVMLTPAAVDTLWHRDYVYHQARVLWPYPRVQFDGADDPFMKPLMISCYNIDLPEWYQPWAWAKGIETPELF